MNEITRRLTGALRELIASPPPTTPTEEEAPFSPVAQLEGVVADLQRRNQEYFDVIRGIERERDEWRERFHRQSALNANAHAMYRRVIDRQTTWLRRALVVLNGFFDKLGADAITEPEDLMALADDVATKYESEIGKLAGIVAPAIDGLRVRANIAASAGPGKEPPPTDMDT